MITMSRALIVACLLSVVLGLVQRSDDCDCQCSTQGQKLEKQMQFICSSFRLCPPGTSSSFRNKWKQPPSLEEIQGVVSSLTLAEAPESSALAFKQGLQGVGESIAKSIVKAMARDDTNGRLNAQV